MGIEVANYLMKILPYPPVDELVTRTDLHATTLTLRGEMAEMRGELVAEMGELRTELKTEMGELRTELKTDMGELRSDFRELRSEFGVLQANTKTDILTLEARLDTRFEKRFSEARALTVRLFAVSLSANAIAVVSAMVL